MKPVTHRNATRLAALALLAPLAACAHDNSGRWPHRTPQLSPATGSVLASCDGLAANLANLANTAITSTTLVGAGTLSVAGKPIAAHCLVTGRMHERTSSVDGNAYAIGFEMRLPVAWNGRFLYQGNGGLDGAVLPALGGSGGGPLTNALHKGFAVISSDAGHAAALGPAFGLDPQARLDYGYQAVGKLTPMAKEVIRNAYGKGPDRSYFAGCSNGGRHAFVAASRYSNEYDGYLAGAPGYRLPLAAVANIWGAQQYAKVATDPADLSTAFTQTERKTVSEAVLARCDALDGAADGLVHASRACQAAFSLQRDVPTCSGARDGSCLTHEQKRVVASIFRGARARGVGEVYSSFPYDAGLATPGVASWEFSAPLTRDSGAVAMIFGTPPVKPAGFDGPAFTLNSDVAELLRSVYRRNATYTESAMSFMPPPDATGLHRLARRGAKMMVYHGMSDHIFSPDDTAAWYHGLQRSHRGRAAEFARYYEVPGMGHCSGGPSTDQFDMLEALVKWVEQGQAPRAIVAAARGPGNVGGANADVPSSWAPNRTRALCPYPGVSTYQGSGSLEDASSFVCR